MDYYTLTDSRPDLAAIEVNLPEGFIGEKILPVTTMSDKSGTIYYATVTADNAAQTSLGAGVAPTAVQIATSSTTFTAVKTQKRGAITPDEAKAMGGIEKADEVGIKYAKRQVQIARENEIRTLILGGTASASFDPALLQTQVQTALDAVRLYEGKTTLVTSTQVLKGIMQGILADSVHGPVLSRIVTGTSSRDAAMGLGLETWKMAIAMYLGVDEVLAGDSSIWNAAAVSGRFAIAKIDDGTDPLAHKWRPVIGKTFQYLPDGSGTPWTATSVGDRVNQNNLYDALIWTDSVVLNSGASYLFDGV